MLKIATWNVNSIRVRQTHVLQWLTKHAPDVLALQEIKTVSKKFPQTEFKNLGYHVFPHGQPAYNGVAILSRYPLTDVMYDIPSFSEDMQRRVMAATIQGIRVINVYVPNGEDVASDKYEYKLLWLNHLQEYVKQNLKKYKDLIILGDFNIAPEEIDVHDPKRWQGKVLFSGPERQAFQQLLKLGFVDSFRLKYPIVAKAFTWWDYRLMAFRRNWGLRIDHILVSQALAAKIADVIIDKNMRALEKPSDHAPVMLHLR